MNDKTVLINNIISFIAYRIYKYTLREKRSFHEMETPWKPCGNYRLIVSIWFPMHGNHSVVST